MSNKLFPTGKSITLTTADKLNVADASDKDQIKTITIQDLMDFMQITTTSTTSTSTSTSSSSSSTTT